MLRQAGGQTLQVDWKPMSDYIVTPITRLTIDLVETPQSLPKRLEDEVDDIWRGKGDGMFNGRVLSCIALHEETIVAKEIDYRQVFAATHEPALRAQLGVMPLAVMAVVLFDEQILVAKRSMKVTQYPGEWEFAPSGSLDTEHAVSWRDQLREELREELGIVTDSEIVPFAILHDLVAPCADICARVELLEEPQVVLSSEYDEWMWAAPDALPKLTPACDKLRQFI